MVLLRPIVGSCAIRLLMGQGVAAWLGQGHVAFPCELLALASSRPGEALLQGFEFYRVQHATAMPDGVPLFGLELSAWEQLRSLLNGRGLNLGESCREREHSITGYPRADGVKRVQG
jgi:hypothetical protein